MTSRMTDWRAKLREQGGIVLQVHLTPSVTKKLNAIAKATGSNKKDCVAMAIENSYKLYE